MKASVESISLAAIRAAQQRMEGIALRTPLIHFESDACDIWLKLENLQPVGSFKIRGAASAITALPQQQLAQGVYTASAGNMAQGVAWMARRLGIPCTVVVPERAPRAKLDAIHRLGGRTIAVPFEAWWQTLARGGYPGTEGHFVHPVADLDVIAGNGTIGLEILEDLPDVQTILVPFGGGGLSCGIASTVRALGSRANVYGCEPATAAPLHASLAAREPVVVERQASFVDGCGGRAVLPEMWPLVKTLIAGAFALPLDEIADAVRLLAERSKVVAEGAGAVALAAALRPDAPGGKTVCIVSGGCIDPATLAQILVGQKAVETAMNHPKGEQSDPRREPAA
jgi:threonine dehydratase